MDSFVPHYSATITCNLQSFNLQFAIDELKRLIEQLAAELQKAPAAQVAKRAEAAVAEAAKPQPDKEDVRYSLERLTKAAANIAAVLPIASQITEQIRRLAG